MRWAIFTLCLLLAVFFALGTGANDGALQSEISGLRSRVTRLESEVGSLQSSLRQRSSAPASPRVPAAAIAADRALSQNPQFKNLAVRVAELQQDLENLEKRLNQLDK